MNRPNEDARMPRSKGIVTGWGAEPFRDRLSDSDASIVKLLLAAGRCFWARPVLGRWPIMTSGMAGSRETGGT